MRIAGVIFVALMVLHIVSALTLNSRGERNRSGQLTWRYGVIAAFPFIALVSRLVRERTRWGRFVAAIQTLLFLLGCWFGYSRGVFSRDLVSPLAIGAGLAAGHVIFGLSLLATHGSARDAAGHFFDFRGLWDFVVDSPKVLMQFINVSIAEEVIYRVGAQPLVIQWTGSPAVGIIAVAVAFSLVHEHFFKNSAGQSTEFMGFALLLGVLYFWTGSLILVIVIHAIRNIEIAFIEHLMRLESVESGEAVGGSEEEYLSGERLLVAVALPGMIEPMFLEYWDDGAPQPAYGGQP